MAYASRLARLNMLVQTDLQALPDRGPTPISDDEESGGIALDPGADAPAEDKQSDGEATSQDPGTKATGAPQSEQPTPQEATQENTETRFVWVSGAASTFNFGSAPKLSTLPSTPLPAADVKRGELASPEDAFTPIVALSKYPYKFCSKDLLQDIATAFFDAGKFWNREWDLFYVRDFDEPTKPLILVRESQVENLLKEINSTLKLRLRITDQQREDGLVAHFPDHPRCLPRYLGRSNSREQYDQMAENTPTTSFRGTGEGPLPPLNEYTIDKFKQLLEDMWDLQRSKSKKTKGQKRIDNLAKQQDMTKLFKRAQRYLGLRPVMSGPAPVSATTMPRIEDTQPAPYPFDKSVVFVCVDVESYERAHHKITEIGIATLDTRDLSGVAPGKDGEIWRTKIKARHFRIKEHAHLINYEFVSGCPDRFDFGTSEFIPLAAAPTVVASCFKPPFCALAPGNQQQSIIGLMENLDLGEDRLLVFLGHDAKMDIQYLQNMGFNPLELKGFLESVDTATLYRVWRREQNQTNLGKILADFDIGGYNLHNAGNDAVYTVQAMLAVCVREASIRGSDERKTMLEETKIERFASYAAEAMQRADDENVAWSDKEDDDGGPPDPTLDNPRREPSTTTPSHRGSSSRGGGGGSYRGRGNGNYQPSYSSNSSDGTHRGYHSGGSSQPHSFAGRKTQVPTTFDGTSDIDTSYDSRGRGRGRARGDNRGRGGARARAGYSPNRGRGRGFAPFAGARGATGGDGNQVCHDLIDLS
ncbi:hypothetical protein BDV96DRAFT_642822 [Lophiotrema nucula]|uniref:Gfd2/YDR514C-like C-terminal domain-containing protein n=1 Tax=Lophiotrema nucula TaxID=690887 RepID=A0A6A5ZHE8_9PLEO|nr:hypothetical protein BDV96DRAFT_642822 [Lophiotrema nucula]